MMYGARLSLLLTGLAAAVTLIVGSLVGFSAAIIGGRYESAINWLSNVLLAIPGLLLAMLFVAAWGPGIAAVVLAVGIGFVPSFGRVTRTIVARLLGEGYVMAAQASGGNRLWITSRHLLPNSLPQLASFAGTYLAWSFLAVTTLTFLGLAGDPSIPEWGALLNSSRAHLQSAPRLAAAPALAITFTVLAVHAIAREEPLR
jgi:ABC-type dipeptide/oligopeptide/nickel transport system permease subunit